MKDMTVDVAILGGGLAGLTLAIQMKKARPATRILVTEKMRHPVPETTHKVGESTLEVGAHYLSRTVGITEHIQREQLPKLGLRFFLSAAGNAGIEPRVEFGPHSFPDVADIFSYQLDRGRLENALRGAARDAGVLFFDDCKVLDVQFAEPRHCLTVRRGGHTQHISARWVVDATGRGGFLKRKLALQQAVDHKVNAAWFRLDAAIDVQQWSTAPAWQARVPGGERRLSTNHLLGTGYWVWLIPLPSGATSVGIVVDDRQHPMNQINHFDKALTWLETHEPQCAAVVAAHRDRLQDFRALRHFSFSCRQVFDAADRWCLTGEAGRFLDPFYSPGTDFIAVNNGLITRLVTDELDGADVAAQAAVYEDSFRFLFDFLLPVYEGQYNLMGSGQVMVAKIAWDSAMYGALLAFLYFQGAIFDAGFMTEVKPLLARFDRLQRRVQAFFQEWAALDQREHQNAYIAIQDWPFMYELIANLVGGAAEMPLPARLADNLAKMERLATAFFRRAAADCLDLDISVDVNPYQISLDSERWAHSGLFGGEHLVGAADIVPGLAQFWLHRPAATAAAMIDSAVPAMAD